MSAGLSTIDPGLQRLGQGVRMARHMHADSYAALVLAGGYAESGATGRWRLVVGDVLIHQSFEAHQDFIGTAGCLLLNLPLHRPALTQGAFRLSDPDSIARLAEHDPGGACALMLEGNLAPIGAAQDWPDLLAAALRTKRRIHLADWAAKTGLAPETVSRGFKHAYGTTPRRYALEAKVRRAIGQIERAQSLAGLACDVGFADQAHLTRAVQAVTGYTPGQLRRTGSSVFKNCRSC